MKADDLQVLIVDDEPDLLKVVAYSFKVFGIKVLEGTNVGEAWEIFSNQEIQLVLADINMKGGSGFELLKKIRDFRSSEPPVFFMTGEENTQLEDVYAEGASGLLIKPFGAAVIRELVQQSCLKKDLKWTIPLRVTPETLVEESVDSLEAGSKVRAGSGGLFFALKFANNLSVGDDIRFDILISSEQPCKSLRGEGSICWKRITEIDGKRFGYGVEIRYLDDDCRDIFSKWTVKKKIRAFIPRN